MASSIRSCNPTTTTTASMTASAAQYSDEATLRAIVTPYEITTSAGTEELTGTVYLFINGSVSCGSSAPAGSVGNDAIAAADDGVAEIDYTLSAAGSYTLAACFYPTNTNFAKSGDTESITVYKGDAEGTTTHNVGAQIGATQFSVTIGIKEARLASGNEPDQNAGQLAGNINNVSSLAAYAAPESGGGNIGGTCVAGSGADRGTER